MGKDLAIQLFQNTLKPTFSLSPPHRKFRIHNKQWGLRHLYLNPHFYEVTPRDWEVISGAFSVYGGL